MEVVEIQKTRQYRDILRSLMLCVGLTILSEYPTATGNLQASGAIGPWPTDITAALLDCGGVSVCAQKEKNRQEAAMKAINKTASRWCWRRRDRLISLQLHEFRGPTDSTLNVLTISSSSSSRRPQRVCNRMLAVTLGVDPSQSVVHKHVAGNRETVTSRAKGRPMRSKRHRSSFAVET